jgi:DNA-directed RNA polymerase subunit RPC12/RpoP
MMKCAKCGTSVNDVRLERVNPKGEKGIWWCITCIKKYEPELAKNIIDDRTDIDNDLDNIFYGNPQI